MRFSSELIRPGEPTLAAPDVLVPRLETVRVELLERVQENEGNLHVGDARLLVLRVEVVDRDLVRPPSASRAFAWCRR